ncbi:unnamed protein product [Mycena citricolor]|uniref:Uncharacterized protein n=1 Tax=Mycena citricolor TaxID=2018698 RepID=A0AAD2JU70_9AGAR|nr:unnamed protein product [Mycena citricolor]
MPSLALQMAPIVDEYNPNRFPSITRIYHVPFASNGPASTAPSATAGASQSRAVTAFEIVLVILVLAPLMGLFLASLCLCLRRRRARVASSPQGGKSDLASRVDVVRLGADKTTFKIPETWDNPSLKSSYSIGHKTNVTLLKEMPRVWNVIGRQNVAKEDAESDRETKRFPKTLAMT